MDLHIQNEDKCNMKSLNGLAFVYRISAYFLATTFQKNASEYFKDFLKSRIIFREYVDRFIDSNLKYTDSLISD